MPVKGTPDEIRAYNRAWYAKGGQPGAIQIYALLDRDRKPRYVGASVNAEARAKTHWQQRERRTTDVATWLRSLHGAPEFWLIQTVPHQDGRAAEQYWIDLLQSVPGMGLVNRARAVKQPRPRKQPLPKEEISARLSAGQQRNIALGNGQEQRRQAVLARWAKYRANKGV